MTDTAPARPDRPRGLRVAVALMASVTVMVVGLAGLFALPASARTLRQPETRVAAFTTPDGQMVGVHPDILAGQRRARAPGYDRTAVGSCVAAETEPVLTEGANGALRDPATGRFAPNPDTVAPEPNDGLHGNSRLSAEPTSLYQLYDLEGNYLKTGITNDPVGRYTQDFMSDKFMDIINVGSRSNMMDLERMIVEFDPGPLNFEPWAGAAG